MSDFEYQLQRGRHAEMEISELLQAHGWRVLPVYDYTGGGNKAPKLHGLAESLVCPDLFAIRRGRSVWFEVKLKTEATYTRFLDRYDTGIDARHWRHYLNVREESGCDVWLVFVHEKEQEIIAAEIGTLIPLMRPAQGMGSDGMAFFPFAHDVWRRCRIEAVR